MAVEDECKLKFLELKAKRNYRFIIFKIHEQKVVVDKLGGPGETYQDSRQLCLPMNAATLSSISISPLTRTARKAKFSSSHGITLGFKFSEMAPDGSRVRSKMVYASSKDRFKRELDGIQVELQATDPSEMSFDIIKARAY
ncbi:hypothetical protein V6N12_049802 [Hibiscus sabdariffa]